MKTNLLQKNIPEDWVKVTLNDALLDLKNGSTSTQVSYKTPFPVTRIETISDGFVNYNKVGYVETIDNLYKLQKGDLLFSNINSVKHIGKLAYFDEDKDLYHGMNLLRLRFNELINKKFGFYVLKSKKTWFEDHAQKAINQASINQTTLGKLELSIPKNINEQKKIAEILSSLDEEIQKIDLIISKTENLKTGLVEDLFTKGIGNKKFKKIKRTSIPQDWEQKILGDVCNLKTGKLDSNRAVLNGEYPFFTCSKETYRIDQYSFDGEAVLLAGNNAAGIYSVKYYKGKFDAYQRTYVITVKDLNILDYHFLKEVINVKLNLLKGMSFGTTTKFLTMSLLLNIDINLPKIDEQKKIANILMSVDDKISAGKNLKDKLIQLKQGLMSDLLSGKVRTI